MISLPTLALLALAGPGNPTAATSALALAPAASEDEARAAFHKARELYRRGQYEEALVEFQRADELHPAPDLQYNIGLCHERLEHWPEMIQAFEMYLRTKPQATDRADVEARIRHAQTLMKVEALTAAQEQENTKPAEEKRPAVEPTEPERRRDDRPPGSHRGLVISGAVLVGLGATTMIAGGVGFGVPLQRRNDDLEDIYDRGNPAETSWPDANDLEDEADRLALGQWVTLGVGGGVTIIGAALLTTGLVRRSRNKRDIAIAPNGLGLQVGGRF